MLGIKLLIQSKDSIIKLRVLQSPEEWRSNLEFIASNGYKIGSRQCPTISNTGLFLWGERRQDDNIIHIYYTRNELESLKIILDMKSALKELSENYDGR